MKLEDAIHAADGLDSKNRLATAKMIDTKVESDMEKAMTMMRSDVDRILAKLDTKFEHIDAKFEHMEDKFSTVYWVVGLMIGFSTALIGIIIALK